MGFIYVGEVLDNLVFFLVLNFILKIIRLLSININNDDDGWEKL